MGEEDGLEDGLPLRDAVGDMFEARLGAEDGLEEG
jgi:hypothetical protein